MTWRLAKSLETLRTQINAAHPGRNKASDGTVGNLAHQATKSEHNPDANGVVRALDITNDPATGVVSRKIAEALIESRDPRILYVISDAEICASYPVTKAGIATPAWVWRPYTGANAHTKHVHISVSEEPTLYDDTRPWAIVAGRSTKPAQFRSLVDGGFFCETPNDKKIPTSIRTNNPGAINASAWVKAYPGYAGDNVTSMSGASANNTAIFEAPEYGVAVWWELMSRYRAAGAMTIGDIIVRYGGGQSNYLGYANTVAQRMGVPVDTEIKLTGDDKTLLAFAKEMFRYEAGKPTPLSDRQILYGFELGRRKGQGAPATVVVGTVVAGAALGWWSDLPWAAFAALVVGAVVVGLIGYRIWQKRKSAEAQK